MRSASTRPPCTPTEYREQLAETSTKTRGHHTPRENIDYDGISRATYFNWRAKYAGTSVAELRRMREIEVENAKLKRMYAELALEKPAIKDALQRKLQGRREALDDGVLVTEHRLPVRRACRAVGLSRTAWYRQPADPVIRDAAVIAALLALVEQHGLTRLRLDGHGWNHKHVHRVYCSLRLNLPRRTKRVSLPDPASHSWPH